MSFDFPFSDIGEGNALGGLENPLFRGCVGDEGSSYRNHPNDGKIQKSMGGRIVTRFPRIQSPCPYKGNIAAILENDICRLCKREVFDLTDMSEKEQASFFKSCSGDVCVRYSLPVRGAAVASLALAATALPAAAQEISQADISVSYSNFDDLQITPSEICPDEEWSDVIFVGGIKDVSAIEMIDPSDEVDLADLPVIYLDEGDL